MSRRKRLVALALVWALALGVGVVSWTRSERQMDVLLACDAANRGEWSEALLRTQGRTGPDETGRAAAECRCTALLATGAGDACVDLLEHILAHPDSGDWAPRPELAVHLVQTRRDAGRGLEAAELARHAARRHPDDADLFYLELTTRGAQEDETRVLEELTARLDSAGPASARMRASLADRHLQRGDPARALEVLGAAVPTDAGEARTRWFEMRGMAFASAGDLEGLDRTYAQWSRTGADPRELEARRALTLSIAGLQPPGSPVVAMLERALEPGSRAPLADPRLEEALTIRLVLSLVTDGRRDDALAAYDRGRARFALEGLSRDELLRSAALQQLAAQPAAARRGVLRFRVANPLPGSQLWLSPEPDAPVDSPYSRLPMPVTGALEASRDVGVAPQRWVYRDAQQRALASGTVSPVAGSSVDVEIRPGAPSAAAQTVLGRRPADGRTRVLLMLLDCADWRLIQYLRARGDLPVVSALLESGARAVLDSDPPLTAAALESLVWPRRRSDGSFVGLLHRFGLELAGLASVGENPLGALRWVLPEATDTFAAIGAGSHTAANLLFAHGGLRAGRHSEISGPQGRRARVPLTTSARDLDAAERERFPILAALKRERDAVHLRTIAAEFDTAEEMARNHAVDFLALRVEPLDILTHAHFAAAVADGQDDGKGLLFEVYRYLDARLGDVHDALDADDVLLVMSDHGIRTAMEHSRYAFFLAAGPGVPHRRAAGTPALRGVSKVVADLLGVTSSEIDAWPDTGIAPWARRPAPRLAGMRSTRNPAPTVH